MEMEVDGQVSDSSSLAVVKFESRGEQDSPATAITDDQNPGEFRSDGNKVVEEQPFFNENDVEDHEFSDDEQVPVDLPAREELVNAPAGPEHYTAAATAVAEGDTSPKLGAENKDADLHIHPVKQPETITPISPVKSSNAKAEDDSKEVSKNESKRKGDDDSGTPEDQAAFMNRLETFYRESALEFKPPKFYGQPLNLLKLWSAVIKLGGYDRVTGMKLWRQVGESFHPPKTCTTVSWTFRNFYEKSLLEYERHKNQSGELQLAVATLPEPSDVENEANGSQASGSGRARRDAAARAMQGWHAQRLFGYGEVGEPIIKDKNVNNMLKREKSLKSIGSVKNKRPTEVEHSVKAARTETAKQLVTNVVDVGPSADWVKINVRETKDCFEVYALVPGLLREERSHQIWFVENLNFTEDGSSMVRVQSDPAGRLVITGHPEQQDNPWGITSFKKVVSLPARIDPLHTSAVVSLHGRLFVRVPFEQSNI